MHDAEAGVDNYQTPKFQAYIPIPLLVVVHLIISSDTHVDVVEVVDSAPVIVKLRLEGKNLSRMFEMHSSLPGRR